MTQKSANFMNEKTVKIKKRADAFKDYAGTYNVEILDSFNPKQQPNDTESAIKSKLIELLSELRGFRFVTRLVLVLKQTESKDKTKHDNFRSSSKVEIIINESDIENVSKLIYTTIIAKMQKSSGKVQVGLLIHSLTIIWVFQSIIL